MINKSTVETNKTDFRSSIPDYSDEQIIAILKKRQQYQKAAAELAIQEAIKRGIINSEQDLFAEEYLEPKKQLTLFPTIESDKIKTRIRKSIARVLLIIGVVPAAWGVLETFKGVFVEGILLFVLGTIWVYLSVKLMRQIQIKILNLLFVLMAVSAVYVVKLLMEMRGLVVMDYFIPIVFYSLVSYGLLFLRRLK